MVRAVVAAGGVALLVALGTVGVAAGPRGPGVVDGSAVAGGRSAAAASEGGAGASAPGSARDRAPAAVLRAPLDDPLTVARPFRAPARRWAAGHRGVDLAAHVGQTVRAPGAGVVTWAGTVVDRGVLTVTHADGLRSSLEPVRWSVRRGQRVLGGQVVGTVAAEPGHCVPATCLHWGLRRGEEYLDPMRWVLDRGPVVLLPLGPDRP